MYPVLIDFGSFAIHSYGLLIAIGVLVAIFLAIRYGHREGLVAEQILDLSVYNIVAMIVGARLFYVIGQWHLYKDRPWEIIMVQRGGLIYLGGILMGILVVLLYARAKKLSALLLLDVFSPGVILASVIGRLGCFFNGCCFGLPAKLPWAMIFPAGSLAYSYFPDEHLHPTQIYAIIGLLLVFALLVWRYKYKRYNGQIFFTALIFYSLHRFMIEFFRYSPIHWFGLTPSQWIVAVLFVVGAFFLIRRARGR